MSARRRQAGRGTTAMLVLAAGCGAAGCGPPPAPDFPAFEVSLPDPAQVDEVIFLIGDAGATEEDRSPILRELSERIETWSGAIARDSGVTVLFLGDIVYPVGVREPDAADFAQDTLRLWNQIRLLAGPEARRRGSLGLFLSGNHDWGNRPGQAGVERLANLDQQLHLAQEQGLRVRLVPAPGQPGPEVIDLRRKTRLIGYDSNWFLQSTSQSERDAFLERFLEAVTEAEDRHIVIAAHHPWSSAGEHGVIEPAGQALGLMYLLKKSGTLVQDLNSPIYTDLRARLRTVFTAADRTPLVYAAGHDHSLQVITGDPEMFEPRYQLVSGAGSKTTAITEFEGLNWGSSHLGYMMVFLLHDEAVRLFVVSTDSDRKVCDEDPPELAACMEDEASRFVLRYSEELIPPASLPERGPGVESSSDREPGAGREPDREGDDGGEGSGAGGVR